MKIKPPLEINYQYELSDQARAFFHSAVLASEGHSLRHIAEIAIEKLHGTSKAVQLDIYGVAAYAVDLKELDDGLPEKVAVYSIDEGRITLIGISDGTARKHPQKVRGPHHGYPTQ